MTDITKWPKLVRKERTEKGTQFEPDGPQQGEYAMVPLDEYHLGNLVSLLRKTASEHETGDWFHELIGRVEAVVERTDITYDDLEAGTNDREHDISDYDSLTAFVYADE